MYYEIRFSVRTGTFSPLRIFVTEVDNEIKERINEKK
ncbi:MAG: hypothetical protein ACI9V1_002186 [Spirosomataceae bacterium]|jgi:hypothetical protein